MLSLSTTAAAQIRKAAADSGAIELALRVAARREPDGSVTYGMGFDEPREGDMPLQIQGVDVVVAPPSQPMLQGIVLDFVEIEPGQFNFIFTPEAAVDAADKPAKACGSGGCNNCAS